MRFYIKDTSFTTQIKILHIISGKVLATSSLGIDCAEITSDGAAENAVSVFTRWAKGV
jgi:hypothetical protein